jgi:hypothetical protein
MFRGIHFRAEVIGSEGRCREEANACQQGD